MTEKLTTKLGTTRAGERTRIWLQGSRLTAYGFVYGGTFSRKWTDKTLVLTVITEKEFMRAKRTERGTVSGSVERPVIDIVGVQVADVFGKRGENAVAYFTDNTITIRAE